MHLDAKAGMIAKAPLRIVIVGGVAGGMSAATRARRLSEDAKITVFEKGPYVSYANCGIPYALGGVIPDDASLILQTPGSLKSRFNVDVRTRSEVIAINRGAKYVTFRQIDDDKESNHSYDKLILAQGAQPVRLRLPGFDLPHVFTLQTIEDLLATRNFIETNNCRRAVIIGGGFIGLEAAENLHHRGLDITIIEQLPHVFPPVDAEIAEPLHAELRKHDIKLHLNARVQEIVKEEQNGVCVKMVDGSRCLADIVIMAVGVRPRTSLAAAAGLVLGRSGGVAVNNYMQTSDPSIYAVGDMVETEHRIIGTPSPLALAGPANRQGRLVADHIFGKKIAYRGNVGTSVCKIFDLTVGVTGASIRVLENLGRNPEWVTVHPPDHAGYYPGASPITLTVIFDPETGKLLGAQAIGKQGVDKRVDVLATAIQAEMGICDLEHLELGYAPPYSSAKDPVNMAGFVGSNILRGDVVVVHARNLYKVPNDWQIVDVRSVSEYSRSHLVGAINLPIDTLRETCRSLEKKNKVLVYCQVGYRGYLAYRILSQLGFDVVNLDGGLKSVAEGGHTALIATSEKL